MQNNSVAVIGAGNHASTNVLPALVRAGFTIDALATRDMKRSAEALLSLGSGGRAYDSAERLLAGTSAKTVIVVAQPKDQTDIAGSAIRAGKNVFVDKPLGWTSSEARVLADAAEDSEVALMIGFMKRYAPIYQQLRSIIRNGELGAVRSFHLQFGCDSSGFCATVEEYVKLAAIHVIDLVRFLFGEVLTVHAANSGSGSRVALAVTMKFQNGVIGTMDLTGLPAYSSETEQIRVTGDLGFVVTHNLDSLHLHQASPGEATWKRLSERSAWYAPAQSTMSGGEQDLYLRGFVGEFSHFIEALSERTEPSSNGRDNVATMKLCEMILGASYERGPRNGSKATDVTPLTPMVFGGPGPFRDQIVEQILAGSKTGSSNLAITYEIDNQPLPRPGDRRALLNSGGSAAAVLEIVGVQVLTVPDVTDAIAFRESASIAEWQKAHVDYFSTLVPKIRKHKGDPNWALSSHEPIVSIEFAVVCKI